MSPVVARLDTLGDLRWIGQRSSTSGWSSPSIASPSTLKMRPSVTLPTGTLIGPPVSRTSTPRARPSVVVIATVRTQLLPRCCWTSHVSGVVPSRRISTALRIAGRWPGGNSISTTGPVIWITLPVSVGAAVAMCSVPPYSRRALRGVQARQLPCLGARRDLDHLAGDIGLADLVVGERVVADEVF